MGVFGQDRPSLVLLAYQAAAGYLSMERPWVRPQWEGVQPVAIGLDSAWLLDLEQGSV